MPVMNIKNVQQTCLKHIEALIMQSLICVI